LKLHQQVVGSRAAINPKLLEQKIEEGDVIVHNDPYRGGLHCPEHTFFKPFFSKGELEQYLNRLEEAKKRDHRKLGKDLGLFHFHPWAPGAAFWLAKGTTVYHTIGNYMRDVLLPNGYVELKTPLVFNKALWETSGHWQHYRQNMFLIENDEEQMAMKAMNCPGHMLVFASETRSYRDLPLRFHEQTPLHRNEASGVMSGLTRVRQFSQDDAHCFVTEDQIASEVESLLKLVQRVYTDFGLEYSAKLSTRPAEFLGEVATWDRAESSLKTALEGAGQAYTINEGDGAFYGPKIDFDITDALGRKWQCATIQLDYQMPERFDLKYVGADNAEHRPVVIHRAIFGSFERFIALLIEHYAGAFPLWLAPVQAIVLPISDRHLEYAGHLGGIRHYKSDGQQDFEGGNTKHFDNPIEAGLDFFKPVKPNTIAKSLAIGTPADGFYALKVMKETEGSAEDVSDDEIRDGAQVRQIEDTVVRRTVRPLAHIASSGDPSSLARTDTEFTPTFSSRTRTGTTSRAFRSSPRRFSAATALRSGVRSHWPRASGA
jgi:hypothetical protein